MELIARYGLQKTTMEDIARRARLKPASVYYYFKSKEDVLAAVVRHQSDTILGRIRRSIEGADTAEGKLIAFLFARFSYMDILTKLGEWETTAAYDAFPMVEQVVHEYCDAAEEMLIEVLILGQEQGELQIDDPKRLGRGMFTVMRAMDAILITNPLDKQTEEGLREMIPIFLRGLKGR
jgi:AcrR family transcriptional regulator